MADNSASPSSKPGAGQSGGAKDGKPNWPKTPAGTVDWETVFENEATGLIPAIARAGTPTALRETAIAIIRQLYARKGDEEETERLIGEMTELITDGMAAEQFAAVAQAVIGMFRQTKEFRQKKAAEYEAELAKKGKVSEAERRKTQQQQQSLKLALARKKKTRMMLVAAVTVVVLAGAGTGAYLYLNQPKLPSSADQILLQQMRAAATGSPYSTHVYGGLLQTRRNLGNVTVTAENIPVDACITVASQLANSGTLSINGKVLPYGALDAAREMCERATRPIRASWVPTN